MLRFILSLVISSVIAIEPALAKIPPATYTPQFSGQSYEGVNHFPRPLESDEKAWAEFLANEIKTAEPTNLEKVAKAQPDIVQLMLKYRDIFAAARVEIDALIAQVGEEKFRLDYLDANKVIHVDGEYGKMEFTNIDGFPVGKITHQPSGVSFLVYDENEIARASKHLEIYIARQHYDAGATRKETHYIDANGKKQKIRAGRDIILMGIKTESREVNVEVSARKRGIKNWWHATYKTPTKRNVMEGFFSGILQFGSSYALAEMVSHILPGYVHGDTPLMVAGFTFAFGTVIGIWNSFYQNWRARGPKWARDLKAMSLSLAYYFGVSVVTGAGVQQLTMIDPSTSLTQTVGFFQAFFDAIASDPAQYAADQASSFTKWMTSITGLGSLALAAKMHFYHNFLANNELKNVGYWLQRIQEIERRDLKVYSKDIPIPIGIQRNAETDKLEVKTWDMKVAISKRFINRQIIYYLPVNWTKFVDQVWFGTTIGPAINGTLPPYFPFISMAGFWTIVIGSTYWMNYWGYKKHKDAAERLKIREDVPYYFPSFYLNGIKNVFKKTSEGMKRRGQQMMKLLGAGPNDTTQAAKDCGQYLEKDKIDRNAS
ncbi:MAG: hypothetical protein AABZ31_00100 [Bdellovibrionota bacterium]